VKRTRVLNLRFRTPVSHWLLVIAYALTTAAVDGGHRHSASDDDASSQCQTACRAPGAHLSGHKSPDLSGGRHDCPACQLRSVQVAALLDEPGEFTAEAERLAVDESRSAGSRPVLRPSSRAPPRA
jgi:hypothetical protein